MISSPGATRGFTPQPPPCPSSYIVPKRGGIDSVYGLYLGGSSLNDCYEQTVLPRQLSLVFLVNRQNIPTGVHDHDRGNDDSVSTELIFYRHNFKTRICFTSFTTSIKTKHPFIQLHFVVLTKLHFYFFATAYLSLCYSMSQCQDYLFN